MTALTKDRNTPERIGNLKSVKMAASVTIFGGAMVMRNSSGNATKGATATGLVGIGRAEKRAVNGTVVGENSVVVRPGVFPFANSTSTDEITAAEIGSVCYCVDDQTVAKTSNSAARSIAGFVEDVDASGVWVRFDEVAVKSYMSGITLPT